MALKGVPLFKSESSIDVPGSQPCLTKEELLDLIARTEYPPSRTGLPVAYGGAPAGTEWPWASHLQHHQGEMRERLKKRALGMILEVWDLSQTGGVISNHFTPNNLKNPGSPYEMKAMSAGIETGVWLLITHGIIIILRVLIHPVMIDQLLEEEAR